MDQSLISIFDMQEGKPELHQSMRDIAALAGVLQDLSDNETFQIPFNVLRFLRVLNIINEEALGMAKVIDNEGTLFYRYRHAFPHDDAMDHAYIKRVVFILSKHNWITKTSRRIKMRDVGKRMMDALIRIANDSLAYYLNDDVARSLFQAKRDAELSEAYDDKGISGGNKLASMIKNVEEAVELLSERELEYLADRHALTQVEVIHQLMQELENKMMDRLDKFSTFEQELALATLKQRGTTAISEGTKISLGTINKILKFTHLQETDFISNIKPEVFRRFMLKSFQPPTGSDIPDAHQILSFMEQGQYEDEQMDGLWVPIKFAGPISPDSIAQGIDYIDNYEPRTEDIEEVIETEYPEMMEAGEDELEKIMGDSQWQMTKNMIQTEHLEAYLEQVKETNLDDMIVHTSSANWADALNSLIGISALVSNQRADMDEEKEKQSLPDQTDRDWRWMEDEQGNFYLRRRKGR